MAISTTFSPTAAITIYRSRSSRNLFNWLPSQTSSYSRITANSLLNTKPNPPKQSIFSNFNKFTVYRTKISHRLESNTSGRYSFCGNNICAIATDPLKAEAKMTATVACIEDGSLLVNGKVLLESVPQNVAVYPVNDGSPSSSAAFVGAGSSIPSSRHVFSLGVLQ